MERGHILISGTGRAGSTFLVVLLTHLGFDTGWRRDSLDPSPIARAGLELDVRSPGAPRIVKSPFLCDYLDEVLESGIPVDHVIIPVRDVAAAAASRARVQRITTGTEDGGQVVPGGLWEAADATQQIAVLQAKLNRLIEIVVRFDVPSTFLWYPRLARDPDYLYRKLRFLLERVERTTFTNTFATVVQPGWIHEFTENDR